MKRVLIAVIVIALFFIILGAVLWKIFTPSKPAPAVNSVSFPTATETPVPTGQAPDQFAAAFYTWYFVNYNNDYGNSSLMAVMEAHLPEWLTPTFAANFQEIADTNDADPIFLGQDSPPVDSKITANVLDQTLSESTVRVLFTSSLGSGGYLVHLLKVNGEWRIDSVASGS